MGKVINTVRLIALLVLSIALIRCGTEEDAKKETPSASPSPSRTTDAPSTPKETCEKPSRSLSGCCSKHSGAKSCGDGMYYFGSDGKLICNDGTSSDTCGK